MVLMSYNTRNIKKFFEDLDRYSIGMDEWFHRFDSLHQTVPNYPPCNVIEEDSVTLKLEVALAGFKLSEIKVYTENNKLFVEGQKDQEPEQNFKHRGLAKRSFVRAWTIPDDLRVEDVKFEDGLLTVRLRKIIPEHQKRKDYL